MDANSVRKLLRDACTAAGGERQFAERAGVTMQWVNAVKHGVRQPRGRILDALGLEMVVSFKRKSP